MEFDFNLYLDVKKSGNGFIIAKNENTPSYVNSCYFQV